MGLVRMLALISGCRRNSCPLWTLVVVLMALGCCVPPTQARKPPGEEADPSYWRRWAERELQEALSRPYNTKAARNIILFVGDGMSLSTVTAARILKGQLKGNNGEEEVLAFEKFPNVALGKTYNVDHQVPDSAATATAFLCGVKANYGTIGLDGRAPRGVCGRSRGRNVTCIAELAQKAGKSTGIVTTGRISHATPAPLYSWSPDRMWEDDSLLPDGVHDEGCPDIASQLMSHVGKNLNVVLGGGRKNLLPQGEADPEHPGLSGQRQDGRNLVREWLAHQRARGRATSARYVWNQRQFDRVDPRKVNALLGLFEHSHMFFDGDRAAGKGDEPSLADMVDKAIKVLQQNPNGFFLLVEAARIDHAHHENTARRALEETLALETAVRRALTLLSPEDTLLVVTADHSHPLTIGSYARRGNPILGLTDFSNDQHQNGLSAVDNLPYTTLTYGNGPGYRKRRNLTGVNTESRSYRQDTAVPTQIVTHDATDVPIYATGPMAHLFHSTHEQHYIFHVMTYAGCLGPAQHPHCASALRVEEPASDVTSCKMTLDVRQNSAVKIDRFFIGCFILVMLLLLTVFLS